MIGFSVELSGKEDSGHTSVRFSVFGICGANSSLEGEFPDGSVAFGGETSVGGGRTSLPAGLPFLAAAAWLGSRRTRAFPPAKGGVPANFRSVGLVVLGDGTPGTSVSDTFLHVVLPRARRGFLPLMGALGDKTPRARLSASLTDRRRGIC